jgi:predicted DCC family thiol-disulfide oxidoreductase YuxK
MLPPRPTDDMVVFFDGVCGLCSRSVDFILARDRTGAIRFAPLQGETAARELGDRRIDSIVVREGGRLYRRSAAVLRIASALGGVWRLLAALARPIPRPLRDLLYDVIARHRYRWFGKRDTCRLPTPEERARFLA